MGEKAIFLDRDGTIIEERNYLKDPAQVVLLSGVATGLKRLQDAGYLLILVTNQSGVGRGYFTMEDVAKVQARLEDLLAQAGVRLTKSYVAPEAPDQPSRGRKPAPQFLFDARDEFGLNLAQCYLIGDKLIDLECGWNAGVRQGILVRTGYGAELERTAPHKISAAIVLDDLPAAAEWILRKNKEETGLHA
jgi:D-glycero-D-manno-heptose 1,7-bisphosphate phosphatase